MKQSKIDMLNAILSGEVIKAPILKENEDGEQELKGTFRTGVKVSLKDGRVLKYSEITDSVTIEYPARQMTYRTGLPILTISGAPVMEKGRKERLSMNEFRRLFAPAFVTQFEEQIQTS